MRSRASRAQRAPTVTNIYTTTDDGLPIETPSPSLTSTRRNPRPASAAAWKPTGPSRQAHAQRPLRADVLNLRDLRWYSPNVAGSYVKAVNGESIIGNNTPTAT